MKQVLLRRAIKLNKERKYRRFINRIVQVLAGFVVFCTTYALILPAITMEPEMLCGLQAHIHGEECYREIQQYEYCCGFVSGNNLDDSDGDVSGNDVSGNNGSISENELSVHVHDENCGTIAGEVVKELICTMEEHEHEDVCYADKSAPVISEYLCGFGEHTHDDTCTDCSVPEHTHSAVCVITDLDLSMDTEDSSDWDAMFAEIPLTDKWSENLLMIAKSQLNYQESRRNCILEDQQLKGYTRYGARYGQSYDDWSLFFVRFCMEYAGIYGYPQESSASEWIMALEQEQLYHTGDNYIPKAGDLVFFCREQETVSLGTMLSEEKQQYADHVGIVTEWITGNEDSPAVLKTIEGDIQDRVCYVTYESQDIRILGFGEMLSGYAEEMTYTGDDYVVTVTMSHEAGIPSDAELSVREILPGTEEYDGYYDQSKESLSEQSGAAIAFARFFDVQFIVNGNKAEPKAPVSVEIRYTEPLALEQKQFGAAVHFAESGVEILDATLSDTTEPADTEQEETKQEELKQVDTFTFTQDSFSVVATVLANSRAIPASVWLDGTCGNMMSYYGSPNLRTTLTDGKLPTAWDSPSKYNYVLKGWYDVTHSRYYQPGEIADVPHNTVFYADWEAASYDIGQANEDTVTSLDTNEFVTTHVFDYNVLFNALSLELLGSSVANADGHEEDWSLVQSGSVDYTQKETLNFIFRDWDSVDLISRPRNENARNTSQSYITPNLPAEVMEQSGVDLIRLLFDPSVESVGKTYLGTGNYLYQYMDDPDDPYYGYYYYDSWKNAASYNQSEERFYVYDYREYTSDAVRDGEHNSGMGDFLPLNSPYANTNGKTVVEVSTGGYQYDAKRNSEGSSANNHATNYHFGMSSNIHFYLPNDAGTTDVNGNYLNKSTTGDPMVFEFSGDDDVWVLLDGELLLDIGGIHGVRSGKIDFSAGLVYADNLDEPIEFTAAEGPHNLTIYYMERGSSKSNCAIYFNLAPRYGLDLTKTDYITGAPLPGVTFEVYNDQECTEPATLWSTHEIAKADSHNKPFQNTTNTFTSGENGIAHIWGFVAGKTYYIKEIAVPEGYAPVDALIRITLNNHGTDISEITVIRYGEDTGGFEVISQSMNKESHLISMNLTNKRIEDLLTDYRVEKIWGESTTIEKPVQVYLTANGEMVGDIVTLSVDNGWGHTWMDLPIEDASGQIISYSAEERELYGYTKHMEESVMEADKVSWVKVGALEDNSVLLLHLDESTVLTAENGTFGSMTLRDAEGNSAAQWYVEAYLDGFRLRSKDEYYLTFDNEEKTFCLVEEDAGNQTFYYDGKQLFTMANNIRYYVAGFNGTHLFYSVNGDETSLYKRVVTYRGTTVMQFTNTQIPEERQKPLIIEKYWEGNLPTLPDKVRVYIKQNGITQAVAELTAENGWKETVEGLDSELLDSGGYTLEEELPFGFSAEFSELEDISGESWVWDSGQNGLETGKTYVFESNGRALTDQNGSLAVTAYNETPVPSQQWQVVESYLTNGTTIQVLKNVETGRYMKEMNQQLSVSANADSNCRVRLINSRLQFYPQSNGGGWSLRIRGNGSIDVQWGSNNGTALNLYRQEISNEYRIRLTNTYGTYVLPSTGGDGTAFCYVFGFLLIAAVLCFYQFRFR